MGWHCGVRKEQQRQETFLVEETFGWEPDKR